MFGGTRQSSALFAQKGKLIAKHLSRAHDALCDETEPALAAGRPLSLGRARMEPTRVTVARPSAEPRFSQPVTAAARGAGLAFCSTNSTRVPTLNWSRNGKLTA